MGANDYDYNHEHEETRGDIMQRQIVGCAFCLVLTFTLACATSPGDDAKTQEMIDRAVALNPTLGSQVDIALDAYWMQPGQIQVTLTNKTTQPLIVGPKFFTIILPGPGRLLIDPLERSIARFPLAGLAPGEQVSGVLLFPYEASVRGARLAFDNTQCRPALAEIQSQ